MSPHDVNDRQGSLQLLDVREPSEWAAGHVPEATHIPLEQLPGRLTEVSHDAPVAVICRTGNRSELATLWLRRQGYDAHNVAGGMVAWHLHQLPILDSQGRPGKVV
jgi:rhodanese-related sulfurtransferase